MLIVVLKQEVRITMPESKNNMQREGENVSTIKPISRVWSIKLIRFFFSFFNHPSCETRTCSNNHKDNIKFQNRRDRPT